MRMIKKWDLVTQAGLRLHLTPPTNLLYYLKKNLRNFKCYDGLVRNMVEGIQS